MSYRLGGVKLGYFLMGKLGRAWVGALVGAWHGAWVHGGDDVGLMMWGLGYILIKREILTDKGELNSLFYMERMFPLWIGCSQGAHLLIKIYNKFELKT